MDNDFINEMKKKEEDIGNIFIHKLESFCNFYKYHFDGEIENWKIDAIIASALGVLADQFTCEGKIKWDAWQEHIKNVL